MDYATLSPMLQHAIAEYRNDQTVGFMLVGSYARDDATSHSDIDLTHFVQGTQPPHTTYPIQGDQLLSLLVTPLPDTHALFTQPQSAIYAVPMWRSARILLDPTGAIRARQQYAHAFTWDQIQVAANRGASYALYQKAEEIITLLGLLKSGDAWGALTLRGFLLSWLGTAIAMRFGVLVRSEKSLFPDVMAHLGQSSSWTQVAQQVIEAPPLSPAIVHLYRETAQLLQDIIQPDHRRLIAFALEKIEQANL